MTDDTEGATEPESRFNFELDPERIEDGLREIGDRIRRLVEDHRYSKIRLSYRGKALLPDIPIALFVAGEAASAMLAGPLRLILLHLGVGSVITVDFVNEADDRVEEGRAAWGEGRVEEAEEAYREALRLRPSSPSALYSLGVLLRVTGRPDEADEAFAEAGEFGTHPDAVRAREMLGQEE